MANHKSAIKRARQSIKKNERNSTTKKSIRTTEKQLRTLIEAKKKDEAQKLLSDYSSKIAKAAQKGILHDNNASRKTSRLAHQVSQISG